MTYKPGTWICDRCDDPVSEHEVVVLKLDVPENSDADWRSGWFAHYHGECWAEVRLALKELIADLRSPLAALEAIPTAAPHEVARIKSSHRPMTQTGRAGVVLDPAFRHALDELPHSVRYQLPRHGITSLAQIAAMSDEQLLALDRIGPKIVAVMRAAVAADTVAEDA